MSAQCLRMVDPNSLTGTVSSVTTAGVNPYANGVGTTTLVDGGVTAGRACWSLPATSFPAGVLAWRVRMVGQWVDGTGSSYGQIGASLYKAWGTVDEVLWSYNSSDMDGGDTLAVSDLTVKQDDGGAWSESIRSELAAGTLQLVAASNLASGAVRSYRIDEIHLIADYCSGAP